MAEFVANLTFGARGEKFAQGEVVTIHDDDLPQWQSLITKGYLRPHERPTSLLPHPTTPIAETIPRPTIVKGKGPVAASGTRYEDTGYVESGPVVHVDNDDPFPETDPETGAEIGDEGDDEDDAPDDSEG